MTNTIINKIEVDLDKLVNQCSVDLVNLKSRYNDEREYEDFKDYKNFISEIFKKFNFTNIKINKKFVIVCDHVSDTFYHVKVTVTNHSVKSLIFSYQ